MPCLIYKFFLIIHNARKKLIYEIIFDFKDEKITPEQLIRDFGLTENEANAWMEYEINFTSKNEQFIRRFFTDPSNRRRLYRTASFNVKMTLNAHTF
jgi:hypothetical protein